MWPTYLNMCIYISFLIFYNKRIQNQKLLNHNFWKSNPLTNYFNKYFYFIHRIKIIEVILVNINNIIIATLKKRFSSH